MSISYGFSEARENEGLQDLHEAEDGDAVLTSKDRDKVIEEPGRPRDLREEEEDALEDDEEMVDDGKHGTTGLKRNTMISNIVSHIGQSVRTRIWTNVLFSR